MEQNQQSTAEQYSEQIEQLMELGRTQGYLTYAEINDLLPEDLIDPEYYDKLLQTLQHDAGIPVLDEAPESDEMMQWKKQRRFYQMWNLKSVVQPILCVCICVKWERLTFLPVKMKSALQNVLKKELTKFKLPLLHTQKR